MLKLYPELIPSTAWFSNVRTNVSAADWQKIRKYTSAIDKDICQCCDRNLANFRKDTHEVWEWRADTADQVLVRLKTLCVSCHEVIHFGFAETRGRGAQALKHLARVNKISLEDAALIVEAAFKEWSQRSNIDWKIDLSYLDTLPFSVQIKS